MALGRRTEARQGELWVARQNLPTSPGHVFYEKLNRLLAGCNRPSALCCECQAWWQEAAEGLG